MAIETLAFLAVSLYATGLGSYFWLKRRSSRDLDYEPVPEPEDLETLAFLQNLDTSTTDEQVLEFFRDLK